MTTLALRNNNIYSFQQISAVDLKTKSKYRFLRVEIAKLSKRASLYFSKMNFFLKGFALGEARTHGLQIMRLTHCLLRYEGLVKTKVQITLYKLPNLRPVGKIRIGCNQVGRNGTRCGKDWM
jgi:hypothetical protein